MRFRLLSSPVVRHARVRTRRRADSSSGAARHCRCRDVSAAVTTATPALTVALTTLSATTAASAVTACVRSLWSSFPPRHTVTCSASDSAGGRELYVSRDVQVCCCSKGRIPGVRRQLTEGEVLNAIRKTVISTRSPTDALLVLLTARYPSQDSLSKTRDSPAADFVGDGTGTRLETTRTR